ncbi:hypothetical protein QUF64_01985 [Anaerolineales bacterium HSG6]|nr:hypothetical protein [Anaerolineales bacterium HSG6]
MSTQIITTVFKKELLDLLEETFERSHGIYLDRDTSLFVTLETISAEEASRPVSARCATLAAQVNHIQLFLQVLIEGSFQQKTLGEVDWDGSWELTTVTADEWETLKRELRETHQLLLTAINDLDVWQGEDDIGASLAILAHTAYHLGEIRQALCTVKNGA